MDLSKQDRVRLSKVLDDRTFELLQNIATQFLIGMNRGTVQQDTAFLTAREAIRREERKLALKRYFEILEELTGREHEE